MDLALLLCGVECHAQTHRERGFQPVDDGRNGGSQRWFVLPAVGDEVMQYAGAVLWELWPHPVDHRGDNTHRLDAILRATSVVQLTRYVKWLVADSQ